MSSHLTHTELNILPYSETFDSEVLVRPTSRLPDTVFSQSPSQLSSWHIPLESGPVPHTPTSRFTNPEQQAYTNIRNITSQGDRRYDRKFFPSARGCGAHALKHPLDPPSSPPQPFVNNPKDSDTIDTISHGMPTCPVFFTDDATMKIGDHIHRQCFNCRTTATKAWRRSVLSPGKLVCNKCGLFERTHAVPRPKTFPRRHRWRPTPVHTNMDHPFDHAENCYHDDGLSVRSLTTDSRFPTPFGPTGGETSSEGKTWVNHGALPPISHPSGPSHTVSPQPPSTPHHTGFQLLSTVPAKAACLAPHFGVSRHSAGVGENRYFDA